MKEPFEQVDDREGGSVSINHPARNIPLGASLDAGDARIHPQSGGEWCHRKKRLCWRTSDTPNFQRLPVLVHGSCVLADSGMLWSGAHVTAARGKGHVARWFPSLTAQNQLDISAGQWNTSPIYGKVGSFSIKLAISNQFSSVATSYGT
jgi:hypothetical protein